MSMVAEGEADLVSFDPGMSYTAGENYNLMPLMAERYVSELATGQSKIKYMSMWEKV